MIRRTPSTLLLAFCVAAVAVFAEEDSDRTDHGAPLSAPQAVPVSGPIGPPPACPSNIQGTLGSGSPDWPSVSGNQTGRLNRNGIASSCAAPKTCLPFDATPGRQYDAYTFNNDTGSVRCVDVMLTVITQAACNLQVNAYQNTYDPANICTGYLADPGVSSGIPPTPIAFSTNVQPGDDLILVVHTTNPGETGCQYDLTMSNECVPGGGGLSYRNLEPCRLLDTRNPDGPLGGPALVAGADRVFTLTGNCNVPSTAKALAVNLAVTSPTTAGNLRLYPAGAPLPDASSINYAAGQTRSNNAVVALDGMGRMAVRCAQASGSAHFILDVFGYFEDVPILAE